MTQTDQQKVIDAGFRIIRSDLHRLVIKLKSSENSCGYKDLEKGFTSRTALNRRMIELLQDPWTIED